MANGKDRNKIHSSGQILINGQKVEWIGRSSLRHNVAIVLQDTVLFSDTVRNNLKYGNENATQEQLEQAAALSRCEGMSAM